MERNLIITPVDKVLGTEMFSVWCKIEYQKERSYRIRSIYSITIILNHHCLRRKLCFLQKPLVILYTTVSAARRLIQEVLPSRGRQTHYSFITTVGGWGGKAASLTLSVIYSIDKQTKSAVYLAFVPTAENFQPQPPFTVAKPTALRLL